MNEIGKNRKYNKNDRGTTDKFEDDTVNQNTYMEDYQDICIEMSF